MPEGLSDLLARWDTHLAARGLAQSTRTAYLDDGARLLRFLLGHLGGGFGPQALGTLALGDLRAFLATERARGRGPRSIARAVAALRNLFGWLEDCEGIPCPAAHGLAAPKAPRRLPRPIPAEDAAALLETVSIAAPAPWIAARDEAVLALLWGAGLRIGEALAIPWGAAPLSDRLRVLGKGGRARTVPLLPQISERVERYRAACPYAPAPEEPLFRGARGGALAQSVVRKAVREARATLGLPESATPHALRHAFATQILASSGDLRGVQELLGHAKLATTQVYTAVDAARLEAVYAAAHPRARRRDR
ncbi:MAG: tyrosine-type recombinase/integrase [Pikeienuella sp.]